jgi:hypothetical protein
MHKKDTNRLTHFKRRFLSQKNAVYTPVLFRVWYRKSVLPYLILYAP